MRNKEARLGFVEDERARRRFELTSAAARGEEMRAAVRDEARSGFSEGANSLPGRKSTPTRSMYTHRCLHRCLHLLLICRSHYSGPGFPRCLSKKPATPKAASQPAPTRREPTSTGDRDCALTTTSPASAARGRPPRAACFLDWTAAIRDIASVSASPVASGSPSSSSAAAAAG